MATELIDIQRIEIPPKNRDQIDETELKSLAATMRSHGLKAPLIVRPIGYGAATHKNGKLNLVAGERRLRAAILLGWKEIECKVEEIDDETAGEVRLIENDQRVPLTAWEEAEHVCSLDSNLPVEEIAKRLGRDPAWVARRKAIARLIEPLKEFVKAQEWPMSHLPLLARFPVEQQPAILEAIVDNQQMEWCEYSYDRNEKQQRKPLVPSYKELEAFLAEYFCLLSSAQWDLDDAKLLPKAGACTACPKRSQAQPLLFPELADSKSDRCLDESCWHAKQGALVSLNVSKLKDKGEKPILVRSHELVPREITEALGDAEIVTTAGLQECKKKTPGARPAIFVSGADAGKVKYVKPYEHSNGSANGNGQAGRVDQLTGEKEPPTTKERQEAIKLKRLCRACEMWSEKLPDLKPVFKGCVDALLIFFGTADKREHRNDAEWDDYAKHKFQLNKDAWEQLYPVFQSRLKRFGPMERGAEIWKEAMSQAKALGLKDVLEKCWKEAVEEIPLSKVLQEAKVKDETAVPA